MRPSYWLVLVWLFSGLSHLSAQELPAVYIQTSLDNVAPYLGQPITYTIKVFDSTASQNLELAFPKFDGFGQEQLPNQEPVTEVQNGIAYTIYTQEIVLYPNKLGNLVIEPTLLHVPETPFQPEQTLQSTQTGVNVQPLPLNAPFAFQNAVGQFSLQATVDLTTIRLGEVVELTMTITGTGNIKQLVTPVLALDTQIWRVFERTPIFLGDNPLNGTQSFKWTLIPQIGGTQTIPPMALTFFNPQTNAYDTVFTSAITITVLSDQTVTPLTPNTIPKPVSQRNLPLKTDLNTPILSEILSIQPPWVLWVIPPLAVGLLALLQRVRTTPLMATRPHNTTKIWQQLTLTQQKTPQDAFATIESTLQAYIATHAKRANLSTSDYIASMPANLQKRLKMCLDQATTGRYAPLVQEDVTNLIKLSRTTVTLIEKWRETR